MNKAELLKIAKPILFNTPMVQAILDGRKTATRRIVKFKGNKNPMWTGYVKDGLNLYNGKNEVCNEKPRYKVGDILYVREAWCKYSKLEDDMVTPIEGTEDYYYWADGENPTPYNTFLIQRAGYDEYSDYPKWRPSIHMPKEAARIFLRVTDVSVERLQDITPKQAVDEGVGDLFYEDIGYSGKSYGTEIDEEYGIAKEQFAWLWNSTVKKADLDRYGWNANPWVWVIEFERLEG